MNKITKQETNQMIKWVLTGLGTFFIYFYLKEQLMIIFPDIKAQLIVGIGILFIAAYFFNLNKYGG